MAKKPDEDIAQTLGIDTPGRIGKRLKRLFLLALLMVAIVLGATVWWSMAANAKTPRYETQPAQRGDLVMTVTATGTLEPTNQVEVGSELSGIIKTVEVDYNDQVKVGQVLARLDTEKLEAQVVRSQALLEAARANVLQTRANVLETRSNLERLREVWEKTDKKAPSKHDLDAAEAAFERAKAAEAGAIAQVSEAEATLNVNRTDLGKAVIRSPINGIVLTREVEPGQTVAASLQAPKLFTLAEDLAKMELRVAVDEADVGLVKEGQEAVFTVDAYPDLSFEGMVIQVRYGSQTVSGVVTYETALTVDNSELLLRPGMTATADITVKKIEGALLVPNAALRFSPPSEEKEATARGAGITSRLVPRMRRYPTRREDASSQRDSKRFVWKLENGVPVPIALSIGSTDGQMTEVLDGEVEPGLPLLVGLEAVRK